MRTMKDSKGKPPVRVLNTHTLPFPFLISRFGPEQDLLGPLLVQMAQQHILQGSPRAHHVRHDAVGLPEVGPHAVDVAAELVE